MSKQRKERRKEFEGRWKVKRKGREDEEKNLKEQEGREKG